MPMQVLRISDGSDAPTAVRRAVEVLNEGGLAVLPMETVYGVAARADRPGAMQRLRSLRGGSTGAFTVHLAEASEAEQYVGQTTELGRRMMRKLWPGPVALVFDVSAQQRRQVAHQGEIQEADLFANGAITLRCPDQTTARNILANVDGPVVATAAMGVQSTEQLSDQLEGLADVLIYDGPPKYGRPSTVVKIGKEGYEIIRPGVYDERIIERLMRTTILFICSGNTCRSAMSEAIAKRVLSEKLSVPEEDLEKKGVTVMSAGSMAMPGSRAAAPAVDALRDWGVDLSGHRSQALSVELIHQADMIFTMGQAHARAVAALSPPAADKVSLLDPKGEIDDPIGGDVALYRHLAGQLRSLIEERLRDKTIP